jgi:hypothetical protein
MSLPDVSVYPLTMPSQSFIVLRYADYVAFCCTTLARNSPIALVAFPEQPLIVLALVIGPLIELPVLSGVAQLPLRIKDGGRLDTLPFIMPNGRIKDSKHLRDFSLGLSQ